MDTGSRSSAFRVLVRGGGDLASGIAWRLHQCGFSVLITEVPQPLSVRRKVSFSEAVYDGVTEVEGVRAVLVRGVEEAPAVWGRREIPVLVDPACEAREPLRPEVLVDAIIAKKNLGTSLQDAPLVIAIGPGFEVGRDAHYVVESNRGHRLGRLLTRGSAEPNTGVPGPVLGITVDRVLRAPADGFWESPLDIGDLVKAGDPIGEVAGHAVTTRIAGVIRGLIRKGLQVEKNLKIGDIDPRGKVADCFTISDKALAIAGGVLEGILRHYPV
jgi:xanthine dehydrogenase accessory factor